MGWTKGQLIGGGFEEIGLANYTFVLQPQQIEQALRRLDVMMADWDGRGIRVGYALPASPDDSTTDDPSGLPDWAYQAVISNLGCFRLATTIGKSPSAEAKQIASDSFLALQSRCEAGNIPCVQMPATMPRGSGNTRVGSGVVRRNFYQPLDTVDDGLS